MKKVIFLLGLALSISMTSCSEEEATMSNPDQSNVQTKSDKEFETMIEPTVGETYDALSEEEPDMQTYVKLKILCKRTTYTTENGDYVGTGVDADGQLWYVTWDYSLQPNGLYTLSVTAHKLRGSSPC